MVMLEKKVPLPSLEMVSVISLVSPLDVCGAWMKTSCSPELLIGSKRLLVVIRRWSCVVQQLSVCICSAFSLTALQTTRTSGCSPPA